MDLSTQNLAIETFLYPARNTHTVQDLPSGSEIVPSIASDIDALVIHMTSEVTTNNDADLIPDSCPMKKHNET